MRRRGPATGGSRCPVCRAGKRIAAEGALCGDGVCGAPPLNTLYLKTGMDCFAALVMTETDYPFLVRMTSARSCVLCGMV